MLQTSKYSKLFKEPGLKGLKELGFLLKQKLEWFEEDTLEYLIMFFLKGNFVFINEVLQKSKIHIDNIHIDSQEELIQLTFLKFISQKISNFKYFLSNWSRKVVIQSVENPVTLNNQIEGRILWKETFRARNYLNYPESTKFVCSSYKNNFDTLENILIKSFLIFLKKLIEKYQKYLQICYKSTNYSLDWRYNALSIYNIINRILNNHYMREISLNPKIWRNKQLINMALHSCSKSNIPFLIYANLLIDLSSSTKRDLLERFLLNYIIKPNSDKTAELYVLFTIIEKINLHVKGTGQFSLIKPKKLQAKNQPVYIKKINEKKKIKIYYQNKPDWISTKYDEEMLFSKTLKNFGLPNVELLPDITIEVVDENYKKVILIEVKNSSESNYLRKGLFQLCNYYECLKKNENSRWENFPSTSATLRKEAILICKEIPEGWPIDLDVIWSKQNVDIKLLSFEKLKNFGTDFLVSGILR